MSPQRARELTPALLSAGVEILVVQGTIISAEHVSDGEPLNLKDFIADLDVPVVAGGVGDYQTALHLMRTGAAGVIVGYGQSSSTTTDEVLGIGVPMATAIVDAAAARRDYLDETGGRYAQVIADGGIATSGDIARAIACGADAVMLGEQLADAEEAPAGGLYWTSSAAHPSLPRSEVTGLAGSGRSLEQVLFGPTESPYGTTNLFGALRRAMAKTGLLGPQGVPAGGADDPRLSPLLGDGALRGPVVKVLPPLRCERDPRQVALGRGGSGVLDVPAVVGALRELLGHGPPLVGDLGVLAEQGGDGVDVLAGIQDALQKGRDRVEHRHGVRSVHLGRR